MKKQTNLNSIWSNLALISTAETHTINCQVASVAKMTVAFLELPATDVVKAETFSKYLSLVENHCFPSIRATQTWSEEIQRRTEEANAEQRCWLEKILEVELPILLPTILMSTTTQKRPNPTERTTITGVKLFILYPRTWESWGISKKYRLMRPGWWAKPYKKTGARTGEHFLHLAPH